MTGSDQIHEMNTLFFYASLDDWWLQTLISSSLRPILTSDIFLNRNWLDRNEIFHISFFVNVIHILSRRFDLSYTRVSESVCCSLTSIEFVTVWVTIVLFKIRHNRYSIFCQFQMSNDNRFEVSIYIEQYIVDICTGSSFLQFDFLFGHSVIYDSFLSKRLLSKLEIIYCLIW